MNYLSIDIETTGLEPDMDQILSIAAVLDTPETRHLPVNELPFFHRLIRHERYHGNAIALAMNSEILRKIGEDDNESWTLPVGKVYETFIMWLQEQGMTGRRMVAAGKNFASFDRQFLGRLDWRFKKLFHHRSLDPGSMFVSSSDSVPPSTEECGNRASLERNEKAHDALEDARYVVRLVRAAVMGGRHGL
jgi:oligoribonuclease